MMWLSCRSVDLKMTERITVEFSTIREVDETTIIDVFKLFTGLAAVSCRNYGWNWIVKYRPFVLECQKLVNSGLSVIVGTVLVFSCIADSFMALRVS